MLASISRISTGSLLRQSTRTPTASLARRFPVAARPTSVRFIVTKRYTEEHEWVSLDTDTSIATISITKHASASLGDVVFVELPNQGATIAAGDQIGAVESVKAAADIYAPVSGTVLEVNEKLNDEPSLLNKSPEDQGWLCKIEVTNPAEIDGLMSDEAYKAFCES